MIRPSISLLVSSVLISFGVSTAQEKGDRVYASDGSGNWNITLSAVSSNAAIEIVESEIELPEEIESGDFEATLRDDLTVSSTIMSGSIGYRVLPFANVYARGGFISSDTETGVIITGTPNGPFSDFFDGPIAVDRDANREVDGYSLGLGTNAFLPITEIWDDTLAAYGGFQYVWNRLDENVSSEGATTSFGLLYPVSRERQNVTYRLGGSYNWISRDVEQSLNFNGEDVRVRVTQEFETPWAVDAGVAIPLTQDTMLGLGVWHQLSGETSVLASLTYRFGIGE